LEFLRFLVIFNRLKNLFKPLEESLASFFLFKQSSPPKQILLLIVQSLFLQPNIEKLFGNLTFSHLVSKFFLVPFELDYFELADPS